MSGDHEAVKVPSTCDYLTKNSRAIVTPTTTAAKPLHRISEAAADTSSCKSPACTTRDGDRSSCGDCLGITALGGAARDPAVTSLGEGDSAPVGTLGCIPSSLNGVLFAALMGICSTTSCTRALYSSCGTCRHASCTPTPPAEHALHPADLILANARSILRCTLWPRQVPNSQASNVSEAYLCGLRAALDLSLDQNRKYLHAYADTALPSCIEHHSKLGMQQQRCHLW